MDGESVYCRQGLDRAGTVIMVLRDTSSRSDPNNIFTMALTRTFCLGGGCGAEAVLEVSLVRL